MRTSDRKKGSQVRFRAGASSTDSVPTVARSLGVTKGRRAGLSATGTGNLVGYRKYCIVSCERASQPK